MADIDDVMSRASGAQPGRSPLQEQMRRDAADKQAAREQEYQSAMQNDDEYNEDVLEDEDVEPEKKLNIKLIGILLIACVIVVLLVVLIKGAAGKKEEVVDEPTADMQPIEIEPEIPVVEEPVIMTNYTAEEMNNLRAIGITSDELNEFMSNNVPYEYVYNTLMEQYWGWHLMNELPTYDMTSQEYKDVISQTWMSLPERHDLAEWTDDYMAYAYDVEANLDYEKVTPFGNQLFLKIYLDDNTHDSWFFLNIRPEEWNQLGSKGNVVVNYTYQTHYKPYENIFDAEEDTNNIFITNASLNIIKSDFAVGGNDTVSSNE